MDFTNIGFLTGVVMATAELLKQTGMNKKLIPVVNIGLGILCGVVFTQGPIQNQIMSGVIIGLTASGVYSAGKHTKEYIGREM